MKNSQERFKGKCEQAEEFVNLKTGQWKLLRLRNRRKKYEEKRTQPKESVDTIKWT